jgi:nicotinamide-nucleotide amidase
MAPKLDARPEVMIGRLLKEKGLTLSVAESCTGGLLSNTITNVPGSSEYFLGGVVAYSNDVKKGILGVRAGTLRMFGAVSSQTAKEMAAGVKKRLKSGVSISITGIAGPGGGSPGKPVGTVFIGVAAGKKVMVRKFSFKGSRLSIKRKSSLGALSMLAELLG